ncbi:unnamed protein product [Staurois parvus]|uniref:Uncharacterized protein n=1 Tax=Staurois parvus TaxID=386267 RepID=A0ABN9EDP2_9NEOB|nr:unnamed protein product [Staurois parvus]
MGPYTASSCCCQAPNLPWAPVPPPHAAARPLICHGPLYRLLMLLPGPESLMGPCTASHCCCLHRHTLPCATFRSPHTAGVFHFLYRVLADYGPPIAAARPLICHGPLYRLLMLLPGPESLMGPCTASHCCCLHRHTLPCATFRSPHTAGVFHFLS